MEYPNEVQIDLHMLRPLVLDGVGGKIHGAVQYYHLVVCSIEKIKSFIKRGKIVISNFI